MRGGAALALRQLASAALGFGGVLAISALLGPEGYGAYVAALALVAGGVAVAQWGVLAWLVRQEGEPDPGSLADATAVLLVLGAGLLAVGFPVVALAFRGDLLPARGTAMPMLLAAAAALPAQVPLALLERRLGYDRIAWTEFAGQLLYLALAVGLAWAWRSPVAIAAAWSAQQIAMAAAWHAQARHFPRCRWRGGGMGAILAYGWRYTSAGGVWQLRALAAPLLIGHLCGSAAVGLVGLAVRLVDAASMFRNILWRMSAPALAQARAEPATMLRLQADLALASTVLVGGCLLALTLAGPALLGLALGPRWDGVAMAFPALAACSIITCVYSPTTSLLHLQGRSLVVTAANLANLALLVAVAALLLPRWGWTGWLAAELAALPALAILALAQRRWIGPARLGEAGLAATALAIGSATAVLGWLALAAPAAWALRPATRVRLRAIAAGGGA